MISDYKVYKIPYGWNYIRDKIINVYCANLMLHLEKPESIKPLEDIWTNISSVKNADNHSDISF